MPAKLLALSITAATLNAAAVQAADLSLKIEGLRNANGVVSICLWKEAGGFPDCSASPSAIQRTVSAAAAAAPIVFKGLKPGAFAISALHDENGDGRLGTNLLGIPTEGIAVSNNRMPRFSGPKFVDATFELKASGWRSVAMQYR